MQKRLHVVLRLQNKLRMNMIKKALYIAFTSCFLTSHLESTIAVGDPAAAPGTTFSFNVGFAQYNENQNRPRLWLASSQTITDDRAKSYALSYIDQIPAEPIANPATGQQYFPTAWPMANPEGAFVFFYNPTTNLVETTNIPNPIYGEAFAFFDMFLNKPVFVMASDLSKVYYGYDIDHPPVGATQRFNKTELLLHDFGSGQNIATLLGANDGIYTAYSSGTFGTNTSYIAKFTQGALAQQGSEKPQPYLQLLAQEQVSVNTPALTNNGPNLASLGSSIALQNFATMTYAGVQAKANNGGASATGIMVVNTVLTEGVYSLSFTPIASSSVISSAFNTVVSAPSHQTIRIKNIAGMRTSTSLNYLIVARDRGTGPQSIYAVPLVSKPGDGYGQIADFTQISNAFGTNPPVFVQRTFDTVLTNPSQIQIDGAFSDQITVGGPIPLANGNIEDLYAVGDSVYIVIGSPYATGTQPGTFRSQAIFAQDGHIINWSPWTRVLGSDNPMLYSHVNKSFTSNFYVSDPTGSGTTFNTVSQTQWTAFQNLSTMFQYSTGAQGGVQGLFNFGQTTPGFNNAMSLLATTGFNNVTIGQTGSISGGNFKILNMTTSDVVTFTNVNNSGALVALELAHSGSNHWLFAGGATGLYVLTDNSTGCTQVGNFTSIANFNAGQTWKTVGDFSYIKKLIWDETFLYVLTPTTIYQIELDPNKFKENPSADLNAKKIMLSYNLFKNSYFLDLIIDHGFCIAGTTQGLYSFNITTNSTATNVAYIAIPDGLPAASQLIVIANSDTPQSNFKTTSNLVVLNNSFATQQARINRFVIEDETVIPFNDAILNDNANPNGIPTSFIKFEQYVSNYFTDGSWNLASNYFLGATQPKAVSSPSLLQIYSGVRNGASSSGSILHLSSAYVPAQFLKQTNMFLGITRESTSGAYIASGNFQARINA